MNNFDYEEEYNHLVKNYVIPEIDQFEMSLWNIFRMFRHLNLANRIAISHGLEEIENTLDTMDEIKYFNHEFENTHVEIRTISCNDKINNHDIDEEVKFCTDNVIIDDEAHYCHKVKSNNIYNEPSDKKEVEVF